MIGRNHLDRLAKDLSAEVLDRHARRFDASHSGEIGINARLIVDNPNLHAAVLRVRRSRKQQREDKTQPGCRMSHGRFPMVSLEAAYTGGDQSVAASKISLTAPIPDRKIDQFGTLVALRYSSRARVGGCRRRGAWT